MMSLSKSYSETMDLLFVLSIDLPRRDLSLGYGSMIFNQNVTLLNLTVLKERASREAAQKTSLREPDLSVG